MLPLSSNCQNSANDDDMSPNSCKEKMTEKEFNNILNIIRFMSVVLCVHLSVIFLLANSTWVYLTAPLATLLAIFLDPHWDWYYIQRPSQQRIKDAFVSILDEFPEWMPMPIKVILLVCISLIVAVFIFRFILFISGNGPSYDYLPFQQLLD